MIRINFADFREEVYNAVALECLLVEPPAPGPLDPETTIATASRCAVMGYLWTTQSAELTYELRAWFSSTSSKDELSMRPRKEMSEQTQKAVAFHARKLMVERAVAMLLSRRHEKASERHAGVADEARHALFCAML